MLLNPSPCIITLFFLCYNKLEILQKYLSTQVLPFFGKTWVERY